MRSHHTRPYWKQVIAFSAILFLFGTGANAQGNVEHYISSGIDAYRAERYEDALRDFEAATELDPDNAEAHFLLARVLFDTPLRDLGRASDEIERARELDPDNLQYMVAELQQLRTDSWNFIQELQRVSKRLNLAQDIFEMDPTNSFAHEELGTYYIRDYYYYRNAISFPNVNFSSRGASQADEEGTDSSDFPGGGLNTGEGGGSDDGSSTPESFLPQELSEDTPGFYELGPMSDLNVTDRFDIETLKSQGAGVLDLSSRAQSAYEKATFHLETAIANDPRRRGVYDHLMRLHALADDWNQAVEIATQMLVYFPEDVDMWLYLGLANHRLGQDDAAETCFREALERMDDSRERTFEDITLLLGRDEQELYMESPDQVASRFWTSQEPRFLTPYNERRLEHYSRLIYADLMYSAPDVDKRGWETERGKIHVRYGVPDSDVMVHGGFQRILEQFSTRPDEYKVTDEEIEANRFNIWDYGDFQLVFEDPLSSGEFRLYSPPADLFAVVGGGAVDRYDYELISRQIFRENPEDYDYAPPGRQIGLPYLVTSFKGEEGRTDLYVHYGIPIAESFDPDTDDVVDLTIKTGSFLISEDRDLLVERRRTLYGLRSSQIEPFEDTQLWTDTQPMEAPPGPHEVSVEFETVGGGTSAVQRREIEVPDFSDDDLSLSSLMLAYNIEETDETSIPGHVIRDFLAIKPAPWSVFHHEQPIYLFFEVYNLGMNGGQTNYEIDAQLRPKDTSSGIARLARSIFGGGDRGVSTSYPVQSNRVDDAQYVILDAATQEPGFYTLTLTITDTITGDSVEETTDLYLE